MRAMKTIATILPWIQIILSALMIMAILLQRSGAEVGGAFGGGDSSSFHTKRGFEKTLFVATIVMAILFAISALAAIILK